MCWKKLLYEEKISHRHLDPIPLSKPKITPFLTSNLYTSLPKNTVLGHQTSKTEFNHIAITVSYAGAIQSNLYPQGPLGTGPRPSPVHVEPQMTPRTLIATKKHRRHSTPTVAHRPEFRTHVPVPAIASNSFRVIPLSPRSALTAVICLSCPPHLIDVAALRGRPRTHSCIKATSTVPRTQVLRSLPSFKRRRGRMGRRQLGPRSCRAPTTRHMFQIPKFNAAVKAQNLNQETRRLRRLEPTRRFMQRLNRPPRPGLTLQSLKHEA